MFQVFHAATKITDAPDVEAALAAVKILLESGKHNVMIQNDTAVVSTTVVGRDASFTPSDPIPQDDRVATISMHIGLFV